MSLLSKEQLRSRFIQELNDGDSSPLTSTRQELDESTLVVELVNFIAAYPRFSRALFDVHGQVDGLGSRLGRGEVLVYFLYDDVELGGSSSSVDVLVNGFPRVEIKCAKREGEKYAHFMLGIDEVPASLRFFYRLLKLFEKGEREGKLLIPESFVNITRVKLEELKNISSSAYQRLEERYLTELLDSKVGSKKYLFFDSELGFPFFFGNFTRQMLKIERISGGLTRLWFSPEGFTS